MSRILRFLAAAMVLAIAAPAFAQVQTGSILVRALDEQAGEGKAIDACEKQDGAKVEVCIDYVLGDRTVRIVVADNGEGIAAEDVKKIFSVFESRKGSRGTGLGLPVSQKILREHGGAIGRSENSIRIMHKF